MDNTHSNMMLAAPRVAVNLDQVISIEIADTDLYISHNSATTELPLRELTRKFKHYLYTIGIRIPAGDWDPGYETWADQVLAEDPDCPIRSADATLMRNSIMKLFSGYYLNGYTPTEVMSLFKELAGGTPCSEKGKLAIRQSLDSVDW